MCRFGAKKISFWSILLYYENAGTFSDRDKILVAIKAWLEKNYAYQNHMQYFSETIQRSSIINQSKNLSKNDHIIYYLRWDTRRGSNNKPSHTVDAHTAEVRDIFLLQSESSSYNIWEKQVW